MNRRLAVGRLALYVEPRDVWVGAYIARRAVYVCPLPCLVIRWDRAVPDVCSLCYEPVTPLTQELAAEHGLDARDFDYVHTASGWPYCDVTATASP